MAMASSTTEMPRILIGRNGTDRLFRPIAESLTEDGYRVEELESSPVGAHSTGSAAQDALNKVDMAFLVIRAVDGKDVGGPVRPFQRIIREAGVIQGKLGMDRVMLLVDDSVKGISSDTGLGVIRYPTDSPESVYDDVIAAIKFAFPPQPRDLHAQHPIRHQVKDEALLVPWVLVAVVVLAAIVPISLALSRLFQDGDSGSETASASVDADGDGAFDGDGDGFGDGDGDGLDSEASNARIVGDGDTVVLNGVAERLDGFDGGLSAGDGGAGSAPAAPRVEIDAGDELLPAICRIDVRKTLTLNETIDCDGAGALLVTGDPGPWHNDIKSIALSKDVVGQVVMEPRSNGATAGSEIVDLVPGTVTLNEADSRFGVQSITLTFSAHGSHVHFNPYDDLGGSAATLIFTLDG